MLFIVNGDVWRDELRHLCWVQRERCRISSAILRFSALVQVVPNYARICRCQVRWAETRLQWLQKNLSWHELKLHTLTLVQLAHLRNSIKVYPVLLKSIEAAFYVLVSKVHAQKHLCWIKGTILKYCSFPFSPFQITLFLPSAKPLNCLLAYH